MFMYDMHPLTQAPWKRRIILITDNNKIHLTWSIIFEDGPPSGKECDSHQM